MKEYVGVNKAVYDRVATEYDRKGAIFTKDYETLLKPFQKGLLRDFGEGASVMHLGCGTGRDMEVMDRSGFEVYGLDISKQMVRIAKLRVPSSKIIIGDFLTKSINEPLRAKARSIY